MNKARQIKHKHKMAGSIAIGVAIGAGFGANTGNMAQAIGFGAAFGVVLGAIWTNRLEQQNHKQVRSVRFNHYAGRVF